MATALGDPLIDEIRAIRAEISARYGNDVRQLCDHLKDVEAEYAKGRLPGQPGPASAAPPTGD